MPPRQGQARTVARTALRARAKLAEDIERLSADAGITPTALAREAGITHGYLSKILAGKAAASLETYAKLAVPLGADLATRLYPNTGPLIRDRHQAPILEALLRLLHPRWRPSLEVGVMRPARGWIDVVLHEPRERRLVAVEIESDIRRIEQQVRWARMKAESLPSWDGWPIDLSPRVGVGDGGVGDSGVGGGATISRLLIVRRTRATRQTALEFGQQLAVAYPAHPEDAIAALEGTKPWPGDALVWAQDARGGVRFLRAR